MKKILYSVLLCCLLFSLTACGSSKGTETIMNETEVKEENPTEKTTEEETKETETAEEEKTKEETTEEETKETETAEEETKDSELGWDSYKIGEVGNYKDENGFDFDVCLMSFDFVKDVYEKDDLGISVSNFSATEPQEGNVLVRVEYTIKSNLKTPIELGLNFGAIYFGDGYSFTSQQPVGIHLIQCGNETTISNSNVSFQPLGEPVKVIAFLEVPKAIKEDESEPLVWWNTGVSFKIR